MIDVVDVRKSFRSGDREVEALRGVSCHIDKGRCAFIVGPSGSGKSTLLYLLGARRPDLGHDPCRRTRPDDDDRGRAERLPA